MTNKVELKPEQEREIRKFYETHFGRILTIDLVDELNIGDPEVFMRNLHRKLCVNLDEKRPVRIL